MDKVIKTIFQKIQKDPHTINLYEDAFDAIKIYKQTDKYAAYARNAELRSLCSKAKKKSTDWDFIERLEEIRKESYHLEAKDIFDSYLIYLEWNRPAQKKFYLPRRKRLKILVEDLQDLADRVIDFLGISLPPRVGKSTLCIMFMTWIMGKYPDTANVMSGHSDKLTDGFYQEILSIITDPVTYLWQEVFPDVKLVGNSAKNETIDLNTKKRFPTITCRSIGGTLTGAVEIGEEGILYSDDLIEDLEESLNVDRLQSKYDAYLNQLKDRKKDGALELMVGTRWNVLDPLGRIQDQYEDNPRYRFRVIPALNEDDESNFDYDYGVGFSTQYYHDMRASIDDATWWAKYMGQPYVREGLLFPREELNYYNGVLPEGECVKKAVCDVAWGGGDSLSMPFAYIFGDAVYIHDVIFNGGDKEVTYPIVVGRSKHHLPSTERFEANNGGSEYADKVDELLRADGIHINIYSRKAPNNQSKLARIIQFAPDIRKFYFIAPKYQSKEYKKFMSEVTTFVQTGKNPHDDAPDSLAMLADELFHGISEVRIFQRPY
nr:MAG TPA: Terminase [Caudoviricetes sp.]